MRCINCNNEIPDGSVVCPICNSNVNPNSGTVPTDTSVLPTVPENPVLPQDQNMDTSNVNMVNQNMGVNEGVTESFNNNPSVLESNNSAVNTLDVEAQGQVNQVATESNGVNQPVTPSEVTISDNFNQQNVSQPVLNNQSTLPSDFSVQSEGVGYSAPEQMMQVQNQETPVSQNNIPENNSGVMETSQVENLPSQNTENVLQSQQVSNAINPEFIAPSGEAVKLGNTLSNEDVKKKNKRNLIIIIVVVLILAVIGGIAYFYYSSQYKSSDKRINAIVSALTMGTKSITNDKIEKTSGTYDIDFSISSADQNLAAKVNGTYAVDLSGKAIDYTVNLSSLNLGEELIDNPVNLEIYLNESRMYVLFQNYYENYIYDEIEELRTLFDTNEQNNIDYVSMINALKTAFASGLKGMHNTQTVGNVNIHNSGSKKANIIKIRFNENNRKIFFKRMFQSLANNKKFISEASKFADMSEEEFKKSLEDIDYEKTAAGMKDVNIEICTAMFGEELIGIRISSESDLMEFYPTANGYGISYKEGSQNIFDITYESTKKNTSTTREKIFKIGAVIYNEGQAYNVNFSMSDIQDVNPKEAKVNVKNSINKKYLTEEDKQNILMASQSAGKIGLYLPTIISIYLNDGISITPPVVDDVLPDSGIDGNGAVDCTIDPSLCL